MLSIDLRQNYNHLRNWVRMFFSISLNFSQAINPNHPGIIVRLLTTLNEGKSFGGNFKRKKDI